MTITESQTYRQPPATANPSAAPAKGQRGLAALVAVVAIAVGAGYYAHQHATKPIPGHGTHGGNGGLTLTSWPADFAAFTALIGSAPGASDAWNGATCIPVTPSSDQMTTEVSCREPDHTTITVAEYVDADTVNGLVSDASMHAGDDETWSQSDGPTAGERVSFADPPEILTSFVSYPTMIVDLYGGSANVYGLQDDWTAAPLPS
jgi:hypothetical protein